MTSDSVDEELSSSFSVKSGVHQGSAFSPLLFIMVMDVLTEDVKDGLLMELLYGDNFVLCGVSLNEVMDKYMTYKIAVEGQGQRVNVDKTKGVQILFGKKSSVFESGERVGSNSVQCMKCQKLVHHHYSDAPRQVSLLSC